VNIPDRLAADPEIEDGTLGIYAFIARLWLLGQGAPVALSRGDIERYDPRLSGGAAMRALNHLVKDGWLLSTGEGREKRAYTPTWGLVGGTPLPWAWGADRHGRPPRHHRWRLDVSLLDVALGQLQPRARGKGTIRRYLTEPGLGLADIGIYARLLADVPLAKGTNLERLHQLGLLGTRGVVVVPSPRELLARLSQQAMWQEQTEAPVLTRAGLRLLGVDPDQPEEAEGQTLFFAPAAMIGPLISDCVGCLIGMDESTEVEDPAAVRGKTRIETPADRFDRNPTNGTNRSSTPTSRTGGGGEAGSDSLREETIPDSPPDIPLVPPKSQGRTRAESRTRAEAPPLPDTPSARRLWEFGVLPNNVIRFANLPLATVENAIRHAETRPRVEDAAAWTVSLLERHMCYGWKIPAPAHDTDDGYAERVRAQLAQEQEPVAVAEEQPRLLMPEELPHIVAPGVTREAEPADELVRLWSQVNNDLQRRLERDAYRAWVRGTTLVALVDGVATVQARSAYHRDRLERCEGALIAECLSARLLQPIKVVITLCAGVPEDLPAPDVGPREEVARAAAPPAPHEGAVQRAPGGLPARPAAPPAAPAGPLAPAAAPVTPADDPSRPAWIAPALWATVPPVLRAALVGSELRDGQIVPANKFFLRPLSDSTYAEVLARLLAAATPVRSA
jgi:hypothetical protein